MRYLVRGRNRKVGAIGVFEQFSLTIEASTPVEAIEKARNQRYAEGFEHVDKCEVIERPSP